ncbi:MAG: Rpn family recombination-promoting nuclease/putative transposase [Bacteroidota bacterium]
MKNLIRFDWAVKRLLRNKANFGILEGFLSELIGEDVKIESILESESNKEDKYQKFNKVYALVQNSKGELIIIEIQNNQEHDYLLRILFGASILLVNNIDEGMNYAQIKKIISINIVYFDLGQGDDYVYRGTTEFKGIHNHDILKLSKDQESLYHTENISKIYPEYYVIKVNQFNDVAKDALDEWIYFFKKDEIKDEFKAKGLKEAKRQLDVMKLSDEERKEYRKYIEQQRYERSLIVSNHKVGKFEGIEEERKRQEENRRLEKIEIAKKLLHSGVDIDIIIKSTGLSKEEIQKLNET